MSEDLTTELDLGATMLIAGAILAVPIVIITTKVILKGRRNRVWFKEVFLELNA